MHKQTFKNIKPGWAPQPCECPDRNRQDLPLQRIAVPPLPSTNKNVHVSGKRKVVGWHGLEISPDLWDDCIFHLHENHKNQPKV